MKGFEFLFVLSMIGAALPSSALAVDPGYPDWPCVQAKVPELSVGVMGRTFYPDVGDSWQDDPKSTISLPV